MKRRIPFKFMPINRCLHHSENNVKEKDPSSGLLERLGLQTVSSGSPPSSKTHQLDHWMNAPRFPVWEPECPLALIFVLAIHNNYPCTFLYHGGSMPGAKRTVYPAQVFTVGRSDSLYLAGWCMNTEAHRVFRIDRIEILG